MTNISIENIQNYKKESPCDYQIIEGLIINL